MFVVMLVMLLVMHAFDAGRMQSVVLLVLLELGLHVTDVLLVEEGRVLAARRPLPRTFCSLL